MDILGATSLLTHGHRKMLLAILETYGKVEKQRIRHLVRLGDPKSKLSDTIPLVVRWPQKEKDRIHVRFKNLKNKLRYIMIELHRFC